MMKLSGLVLLMMDWKANGFAEKRTRGCQGNLSICNKKAGRYEDFMGTSSVVLQCVGRA